MYGKSAFIALALAGSLMAPVNSFAQDAGVSGIPRGPGSAGGLNNSVNDPSGIGNALKPLPPPALSPAAVPTGIPPAASRASSKPGIVVTRGPRQARSSSRRSSAARAAVRAQDGLVDRKLSICKGC
jgi:hypothetical protein